MMATAASLQAHADEISAQAAVLPLAAAPKGFDHLDIASLADSPEAANKVSVILSRAVAGLRECQLCGCSCSAGQLGFLVTKQLDFAARSVRAAAGHFACEVCRALSSPGLLLELSMPVQQSEDLSRAEQLQVIFIHFAAVNAAPERITRSPEALALWVQELASRAYSMHVVASSLKGWQLHSPSGQLVQPNTAGAAERLLQELLQKGAISKTDNATPGKRQQQSGSSSAAKAGKRKSVAAHEAVAGGSKKKVRKLADVPAAAALAGKQTSVQQGELAPKQAAKIAKQQKQQRQPADMHQAQQQQATKQQKQQQQQQQPGHSTKDQELVAKTAKASTAAAAARGQQQLQAGGTSIGKKLSNHPQARHDANGQAEASSTGKKLKKAAATAAVPFKTPQAARTGKLERRLSAA